MKGIDISAWQDNIDWQAAKAAGIEFAIVKLGQAFRLDSKFVEHINNALAVGLEVGLYYYSTATDASQALAEADWVRARITELLNDRFPTMGVWYDVEDPAMEGADITSICQAFIRHIPSAGIYSSYNWLTNGNIRTEELPDVPIWCAQYNFECNFTGSNLRIWQYTDALDIAGTNFDGNMFYEDVR